MNIADLRKSYEKAELSEDASDANPLKQFERWLNEAIQSEVPEPNAMTVATVAALSVVATVVESAVAVANTSTIVESPSESAATAAALSAMTSTVSGGNGGGGGGGSIWLKVTQTKLLLSTVRVIPTLPLVCFHCPSCCRQRSQCRGRS